MDALRRHPEWAPYIKRGQNANDWNLVPPKGWKVTEKDKQDYEAAKKYLGLDKKPSLSSPTQPITVPGPPPPNVPAGTPMQVRTNHTEAIEKGDKQALRVVEEQRATIRAPRDSAAKRVGEKTHLARRTASNWHDERVQESL